MKLFSEIDEAFAIADQPLSRGAHFQKDAVRIWTSQTNEASVANVQALLILAMR